MMWEELKAGQTIKYADVYVTKQGVFNYDHQKLSDVMYVDERRQEVKDGKGFIVLAFAINGNLQCEIFTTEEFEEKKIRLLSQFGFLVQQAHKSILNEYLIEQYQTLTSRKTYTHIGFLPTSSMIHKDQIVFGLCRPIATEKQALKWDQQNCDFNVAVEGSLGEWQRMVKKQVIPSPNLTLALGLGLSSIIIGYLKRTGESVDTAIFHLVGRSTTGKTTAGALAVSVWGRPTKGEKGLFQSWNATANAMMKRLGKNNGVALLLDETSMSEIKDFTNVIYRLAEGGDKERSTKTGDLAAKSEWATTLITTGESSVLENTNKNGGLYVRMQEFADIQWTDSAAQADTIKSVIANNYGGAGIRFARKLAKNWSVIPITYKKWMKKFKKTLPKSEYSDRVIQRYAAILTGLELAQEPLQLKFNLKEVFKLINNVESALANERNIAKTVYDAVLKDVPVTFNSFIFGKSHPIGECKGKISKRRGYYEVSYYLQAFEKLIQPFATNIKVVEESLKDAPFYLRERDRNYKRIPTAGGSKIVTYSFKVPEATILTSNDE
ncbi:DUF927 domain-containing protein [Metasolibacillus sp.]|uniref:DUF927 domain-containing protein n=1 Tax=Metasolibacillus sp. TaxID=2703680 RepID=UPI0026004A76|nr:DUF927 domain-containing protein [Metasolibacillus sp.]MCT6924232.1 DUF927 domain-containing protein [Metasolibacillus sp.]MCT6940366.1 DUF927 domain-containing protein [Metasolibacillus sp.]